MVETVLGSRKGRGIGAGRFSLPILMSGSFVWGSIAALPAIAGQSAPAQQNEPGTTLTLRSNLVEVPALVTARNGDVVFALAASDFVLTDNGAAQKVEIAADTDSRPIALAVIAETGGAGARHLDDYRGLGSILDSFAGAVERRTALIAFDSTPHLVAPFAPGSDAVAGRLGRLEAGDNGAAILDAVTFGVELLRREPQQYRRAILLLSETVDQGSTTTRTAALRMISDTNTTMYSFAFSSSSAAMSHEASKFNRPDQPGPAHGCFSRDHTGDATDAEYDGHYSRQVLDCISDLAPPLRLATMAFLGAHDALRTKTAESVAALSGGAFFHFRNAGELRAELIRASRQAPNVYVLSFRPSDPSAGPHAIHLSVKDRPGLRVQARTGYWIDSESP